MGQESLKIFAAGEAFIHGADGVPVAELPQGPGSAK